MNTILINFLSFIAGALIFYILILIKLIPICNNYNNSSKKLICPTTPVGNNISLKDKIINSFQNTINNRLQKIKLHQHYFNIFERDDIYFQDYSKFFNENPEYINFKHQKDDIITQLPHEALSFFIFIEDILKIHLIRINDEIITDMNDLNLMHWLTIKEYLRYIAKMSTDVEPPTNISMANLAALKYKKIRNAI